MPPAAQLVQTEHGLVPESEGWFVVNARETAWQHTAELGSACTFEGGAPFAACGCAPGTSSTARPGQSMSSSGRGRGRARS